MRAAGKYQMDVKAKSVTGFYDDEAARIAKTAAQAPLAAKPIEKPVEPSSYVPPVRLDEPQRAPLTPEPPTNQNIRISTDAPAVRPATRRGWRPVRVAAWVVLTPWYVAVAAASVALIFLFVKDLLGL